MMAADQGDVVNVGGGGADHISGLPDHLLHSILLLVPGATAADAARTSVLSRRWRHVWASLPELAFGHRFTRASRDAAPAHALIDAALAAYSAPTVRRLDITAPYDSPRLTAARVASWLRFAARRLAGDLRLTLQHDWAPDGDPHEDYVLPLWGTVTAITLELVGRGLGFQLGGASAFTALATLKIQKASVDSRELEHVLSARCPVLKELVLNWITLSDGAPVFSIRSGSLRRLEMTAAGFTDLGLLRVATPELRVLDQHGIFCDAYIAAPKLSELYWHNLYDPSRQRFAEAGRHLRRMEVAAGGTPTMALMNRFDIVDELHLTLEVPPGAHHYEKFLEETNKLAKCEVLVVKFMAVKHDFKPIMVHLLHQCAGTIRKLVVDFFFRMGDSPCNSRGCPCSRLENRMTNRIALPSLEQLEVTGNGEEDHIVELVRMLCKRHETFNKKVSISVPGCTLLRRKIRSIVPLNDKYEITL